MSKTKSVLLVVVLVVAALLVVMVVTAPKPETGGQPGAGQEAAKLSPTEPPPAPTIQASERRFEVLVVKASDTYRVRDTSSQEELDLFLPSDAIITAGKREAIKAGAILTVQRFVPATNGLVGLELSVATAE